jgi:hypothetical protein
VRTSKYTSRPSGSQNTTGFCWIDHDPAFGPAQTIVALTPLLCSALDAYLVAVSAPADDRDDDDDLPSDDIPF